MRWLFLALLATTVACTCSDDDESRERGSAEPRERAEAVQAEESHLRARLYGTWRGEPTGEMAEQLAIGRLVMQVEEPTHEQLAELSTTNRADVMAQRQELAAAQGAEAQMARMLMQTLVDVFDEVDLVATDETISLRMGRGEAPQVSTYEVLEERGQTLRIRSTTEDGEVHVTTIVFESRNRFRMQLVKNQDVVELLFIRVEG